jgi:hypothetical protein
MMVVERSLIGLLLGLIFVILARIMPPKLSSKREWAILLFGFGGFLLVNVSVLVLTQRLSNNALFAIDPHPGIVPEILAKSLAIIGAVYSVSIGSQLIENVVRKSQGLRPRKIEWVKRQKKPRAKKSTNRTVGSDRV